MDPFSASDAIFVGRVIEIWPPRQSFARDEHLNFAQEKRLILYRWRGVLSKEEERRISTSSEWSGSDADFVYMQRIRVVVKESFTGPTTREIYTSATSCGIRFRLNQTYLIVSNPKGSRYYTGACSGTAPIDSHDAVRDLKVLRDWKAGISLLPQIEGSIDPEDLRPNLRVRLVRDQEVTSIFPGADGIFSVDRLAKAQYRLQVEDGRGKAETLIDLSNRACFQASIRFSDGWSINVWPFLEEKTLSIPDLPDPPRIP